MDAELAIKGIHHITLVASRTERNAHFYVDVLGFRLVKRATNLDRPNTEHLIFGDEAGSPGSLVTFFEWPDAPPARLGVGSTHHLAMTVSSYKGLLQWKTWLQHAHRLVAGPFDHRAYRSIIITDPDGVIFEIATSDPGWEMVPGQPDAFIPANDRLATETWPAPVPEISQDMRLRGLHHIAAISSDLERTDAFYQEVLSIPCLNRTVDAGDRGTRRWYWSTETGADAGRPGTVIIYTQGGNRERGQVGRGVTHHFALQVRSEDALHLWRERLLERGIEVSEVRDREYFRSIYFHGPDGEGLELATPPNWNADKGG